MFVAFDSSDVWSNQEYFDLDPEGAPNKVAGVPLTTSARADRDGETLFITGDHARGRLQLVDSQIQKGAGRLRSCKDRSFQGFICVLGSAGKEETAVNGEWTETPGRELLEALSQSIRKDGTDELPLIAEDLGIITDDVRELMADFGLPGMKVLLFAFDGEVGSTLMHRIARSRICRLYRHT